MPLAILEPGEERFLDDADTLKLADEYCVEDLEKVRDELKAKELPGEMSITEVTDLLSEIDKIREKVKQRVIRY